MPCQRGPSLPHPTATSSRDEGDGPDKRGRHQVGRIAQVDPTPARTWKQARAELSPAWVLTRGAELSAPDTFAVSVARERRGGRKHKKPAHYQIYDVIHPPLSHRVFLVFLKSGKAQSRTGWGFFFCLSLLDLHGFTYLPIPRLWSSFHLSSLVVFFPAWVLVSLSGPGLDGHCSV